MRYTGGMNRQAVIVLALAIAIPSVSCKREEARAVASAPSGTADKGDETKVVVKGAGNGKVVVADKEIASAVDKLMNDPAEKATAADAAKRKDPTQLLGRWNIAHTVMLTNGEGGPVKPLAPTSWTFDKDGGLAIAGGMSMKMKYIYTGDKLIVTGTRRFSQKAVIIRV